MERTELLELYEVQYSDFMLLSSDYIKASFSLGEPELERLSLIQSNIMKTLGPMGSGLLAINGVPNASSLHRLLKIARKLALLDPNQRKRLLKEHNLGSDVPLKNPNRSVSSFAMQLTFAYALQQYDNNSAKDHIFTSEQYASHNNEYKNLGNKLKELGFFMMELGLRLAQVCDSAIGGQELEQSLLESSSAKGRLIHYHSLFDCWLLNEANTKKGGKKKMVPRGSYHEAKLSSNIDSNLWQQWHYDYGIFTVLTVPSFTLPCYEQANMEAKDQDLESGYDDECVVSPSGHTYLQIYDPNKKRVFMVKASPESFIIQVGESADIISKGKLRATLHSVGRPADMLDSLSRQTFVVFLQPAWNKVFDVLDYPINLDSLCDEKKRIVEGDQSLLDEEIQKIVPPLWSRLKDGMSFADFSKETTKQYYGSSGLQSNR